MSDWRQDPATEAQKRRLKAEGMDFHENITKGEASDLIGTTEEPDEHEIAILKFFKISGISEMSQIDARRKIDEIFADEQKAKKWADRPADKTQKDIYKFFNIPIPTDLRYKDAEKFTNELFEDEEKLKAWDNHEDKLEGRESWFEDALDLINIDNDLYNCKKISKKLFKQIVESLESSGMTLEQIEEKQDLIFQKAIDIDPSIRKATSSTQKAYSLKASSKKNKAGCSVVLTLVTLIISLLIVKLIR
jgi:hypothetical protein